MVGFVMNEGKSRDGASQSSIDLILPKRIAFHPARKPTEMFLSGDFKLETLNPDLNHHKPSSNPPGSSHVIKKLEAANAHELSFDLELTLGIGFKRIGAGLANLGNTCYLNSVLQCLTYTEPLAAYLQSGKHKSSCHTAGFCAMCAIQNHVRSALESSGKILSPMHLVRNLRSISHNFRTSRQEDAHEYMVNLMESMHKCCLPSGVSSETPSAYEKSLVHKIFGGRLRSQVKCTQCSYCSNTFDPFLDLSLEIVKADSLSKALARFTAVEELDGGQRQYQCAHCKVKVRAHKQLTIHKAPYVLTIHLKRFGSGEPGQKINKKVEFGTMLDLKPYVSGPYEGELKYSLYGVLVHAGWSTHSGHYYCFVRTSSGIWHALDDNRVSQVSEKSVMEQKAYMLFYVFDRKNSILKKSNIIQNGMCLDPVNRAVEGSWNNKTGIRNGNTVSAASMSMEAALFKTHVQSESSDLKTGVNMALGCLQQSAPSTKAGSNATVRSSGSAQATFNDANTVIVNGYHPDKSNNRISKQLPEEKLATLPNGSSELHLTKSNNVIADNIDMFRAGIPQEDYVQKAAILPHEHNPHIPSPKKLLTENGSIHYQLGGSGAEIRSGHLPRILKQHGCARAVESQTQVSIEAQLTVRKGCSREVLKKNMGCVVLVQERTTRKQSKKKRYFHRMPVSRGKMFLAVLKVRKDYKHKLRRSRGKQGIGKDFVDDKSKMQNTVSGPADRDLVHAESPSWPIATCKENDYANTTNHNPCVNCGTSSKKGDGRERNVQRTPSETKVACSLTCVREANGQLKRTVQDKFLNLLSRGLSQITVARWDDGEASESYEFQQFQGKPSTSVGYVLDEWDEEYDLGRRKKIRKSKHITGAENPFQEIAAKKAKLRHSNLKQTTSGHQPLRI